MIKSFCQSEDLNSAHRMDFYLNQVLHAFSRMDSELLEELLDANQTYQDMLMPVFVSKLAWRFEYMKKRGDAFLIVEKGHCCNLDCNPDLNRTAYRFIGNHTRDHMDFRFALDVSDDGKTYLIKEIFECYYFNFGRNEEAYGDHLILQIYDDDKKSFYLSPDEQIHIQIALQAVEEMKPTGEYIHIDELITWTYKYRRTFDFIIESLNVDSFRLLSWDPFFELFEEYDGYLSLFEKWSQLPLVELSRSEEDLSEEELIQVLCDAEKVIDEDGHHYVYHVLKAEEGYRIHCDRSKLIGGNADIFSETFPWLLNMQKPLVKKYYALTESETIQFLDTTDVPDPLASVQMLSFHLEVRERARKQGEIIPFGLGER